MTEPRCGNCQYAAFEPDYGLYCSHPESFKSAPMFGRGVNFMRKAGGLCAAGRLFERCTCTSEHCPRHSKGWLE